VYRSLCVIRFTFLMFLAHCVPTNAAPPKLVVVQLLNGRNGKPLANVRVYVSFDDHKGRKSLDLISNGRGEIEFDASGAGTFQVHPIALVPCGEQYIGNPDRNYAIDEVLGPGILTKNDCGHLESEPLRGRLLYFARRATWWELFRN